MRLRIGWAGVRIATALIWLEATGAAQPPYAVSYLTQPTMTHGVHGMTFNAAGDLLVGDVIGFTVWKVNIHSGKAVPLILPPYGCADDLSIAPDGTLAWTSLLTGHVYALSPQGRRYVIARGLPGVNSIEFAPDGRLFVTQLIGSGKLWQLDPKGQQQPRLIMDDVSGLNGFRIDANNILWGPRGQKGDIIRLNLETLDQRVIASGFIWPTGVDMGKDGLLYAVDLTAGTLTRVDPTTGLKTLVRQLDPGIDNLTINATTGLIYVSNSADNSIYEVDPQTAAVRYVRRGQIGVPGGLAVSTSGGADTVYFANTFSFAKIESGGVVTDLGRRIGAGAIHSATSIRYSQSKLILSHFEEGQVRVANPENGAIDRTIENVEAPYDAIMLANGDIIVAEHRAGRLLRISSDESRSTVAHGLMGPVGLVAEDENHVLVTEAARGSLTRVNIATGKKVIVRAGLKRPEGLDLGSEGSVFVAEAASGKLTRIDPNTGGRSLVVSGLPRPISPPAPMDPVWIPMGVAVGQNGVVYVSLNGIGTIAKITPGE